MSDEMKACPLCGENILAVAKKCKHCGEMLDGSGQVSTTGDSPNSKSKSTNQAMLYIVLGFALCGLWFGAHLYFLFYMDTAIFGGVFLLYGIIQYAKKS
jgi:uncharacterized membrane protein YvbJ